MSNDELPPILEDAELAAPPEAQAPNAASALSEAAAKPADDSAHANEADDEEEEVRIKKVFEGAPLWVVTFGDLMSLLLTFFVLLLSFSTMDPVRFKLVRGSLDRALGIQKIDPAKHAPKAENLLAVTYNRRDFTKQVEAILKRSLRDTFPAGQQAGRVEKVVDIRGEVVRFIAYDVFLPGTEEPAPKAKMVFRAMADALNSSGGRMEVRGLATESFAKDDRRRGVRGSDGVRSITVAGRRAVIASAGVHKIYKQQIKRRSILPAVVPGLERPAPSGVVNLTEFVFLAPDSGAQKP